MPHNSRKYYPLVCFIFLLASTIFLFYLDWQSSNRVLTFAMLDVGQGDALFIESPTGTQIIVDSGNARKITGPLLRVMSPFDKTIDAIIITNPDADHIGGFGDILKKYKIGAVFEPGTINDSKTFQNLKQEIARQKIPDLLAKRGMRLHIGDGAYIDILFPDRDVTLYNSNEGSVVARLTYGETSVMLTGDATSATEKIILNNTTPSEINSDILKVGHHGSRSSTSTAFVAEVAPRYAFISDGKDNSYGHPHAEVLRTLASQGVKVQRTDLLGNIIMKCDRMAICEIKTSKN